MYYEQHSIHCKEEKHWILFYSPSGRASQAPAPCFDIVHDISSIIDSLHIAACFSKSRRRILRRGYFTPYHILSVNPWPSTFRHDSTQISLIRSLHWPRLRRPHHLFVCLLTSFGRGCHFFLSGGISNSEAGVKFDLLYFGAL